MTNHDKLMASNLRTLLTYPLEARRLSRIARGLRSSAAPLPFPTARGPASRAHTYPSPSILTAHRAWSAHLSESHPPPPCRTDPCVDIRAPDDPVTSPILGAVTSSQMPRPFYRARERGPRSPGVGCGPLRGHCSVCCRCRGKNPSRRERRNGRHIAPTWRLLPRGPPRGDEPSCPSSLRRKHFLENRKRDGT